MSGQAGLARLPYSRFKGKLPWTASRHIGALKSKPLIYLASFACNDLSLDKSQSVFCTSDKRKSIVICLHAFAFSWRHSLFKSIWIEQASNFNLLILKRQNQSATSWASWCTTLYSRCFAEVFARGLAWTCSICAIHWILPYHRQCALNRGPESVIGLHICSWHLKIPLIEPSGSKVWSLIICFSYLEFSRLGSPSQKSHCTSMCLSVRL